MIKVKNLAMKKRNVSVDDQTLSVRQSNLEYARNGMNMIRNHSEIKMLKGEAQVRIVDQLKEIGTIGALPGKPRLSIIESQVDQSCMMKSQSKPQISKIHKLVKDTPSSSAKGKFDRMKLPVAQSQPYLKLKGLLTSDEPPEIKKPERFLPEEKFSFSPKSSKHGSLAQSKTPTLPPIGGAST